ncbi:PrsW family intramembrane metalloprotease [Candidatus Parcubacteria bacterium]|nr:MAG: PrsW family intramembrane metalloprotease [Candidatus Parcubacteria bacterium]
MYKMNTVAVLGAILGGVGPTLLWLWFWLREDSKHPEPRRLIALAFLAGMISVAVVIPIEQWAASMIHANYYWLVQTFNFTFTADNLVFLAWSAIEELVKFGLAALAVLRLSADDEPIDPIIYMVVVALGFAAAENTLFLLSPLAGATLPQAIITGDYRFVGATLLHVLASAVIGCSMALAFYKTRAKKIQYITAGVILSIGLHGLFNFLIMNTAPEHMIRTFSFVWAGLIALLAFMEFVKRIPVRRSMIK